MEGEKVYNLRFPDKYKDSNLFRPFRNISLVKIKKKDAFSYFCTMIYMVHIYIYMFKFNYRPLALFWFFVV
jgi:hypothetical protein